MSYALCRHDLETLEAVTLGRMAILLQHVEFQFLNAGDHGLALLLVGGISLIETPRL